jgi:hypothetical protein
VAKGQGTVRLHVSSVSSSAYNTSFDKYIKLNRNMLDILCNRRNAPSRRTKPPRARRSDLGSLRRVSTHPRPISCRDKAVAMAEWVRSRMKSAGVDAWGVRVHRRIPRRTPSSSLEPDGDGPVVRQFDSLGLNSTRATSDDVGEETRARGQRPAETLQVGRVDHEILDPVRHQEAVQPEAVATCLVEADRASRLR